MPERPPAVRDAIAYLRSLTAIRERCQQMLEQANLPNADTITDALRRLAEY